MANNNELAKSLNEWKEELLQPVAEMSKQMNNLVSKKDKKEIDLKARETILEDLKAPDAIDLSGLKKEINALEKTITDLRISIRDKENTNSPYINAIDKRLDLIKEQNRISDTANKRTK